MGNVIDLSGKVFSYLTVISRANNDKEGRAQWNCLCVCGNKTIVSGKYLRSGHTKSCGKCIQRGVAPEDLIGLKFGRLFVESYHGKGSHTSLWNCVCDCGNRSVVSMSNLKSGHVQSCGCLGREKSKARMVDDLTGLSFGRWRVLHWSKKDNRNQNLWLCQCECGTKKELTTGILQSGVSHSCGCLKREETHNRSFLDLTDCRFGKLVATKRVGTTKHKTPIWECKCDCGNTVFIPTNHLRSGHTQSCGCEISFGEYAIRKFLNDHNIQYKTQKMFIGCSDIDKLRFDFWLPSYGLCIEFDGDQHYKPVPLWDSNDTSEDRQRRDAIKTKYCEENDIILLRIPYWEKDNIESILSDWLF